MAVGLAAAIVVLAATVAGGWMWRAREHERRAIRVDLALRDLVMLYDQAGVGGDDLARWATARAAARRAEQLVDDARDHATRSRIIALRDEVNEKLEEARSDAKLLIALAEIHDDIDDVPSSQTDAAFAATFRAARLDLETIPPAEAGQAIARRPARVALALAAAIDRWAELRRNRRDCDGAALLTAAARAADPDEWRDRLRKALTECGKGAQRAALGELARSTSHAELPPFTLALLGAALLDAGDAAAAESVLRPAQRRFPGDLWLAQSLAKTLEKLSRRDEAIRYYMTARAVRPEAAHPLAHALERQGEPDEAIAVFRELVRLSPTNARHLGCLGKALRSRGLAREANQALDAAIDAARAAIGLQPDDPMPHALLGMALRERGRLDEAITQYREAIRLGPNYVSPHINFGITLHRAGRADDAIAQYLESIRLQPDYAEAHCRLGEVLRDAKHDLDGSIAAFRQALRLEPNDASIHFNLGIAFGIKGQYDDAISEYRAAIHQLPSSAEAHCNVGAILCDIKHDFDGAVAEFREAIRLGPDNAKAHYDLGNALQHSAQNDEAIAAYRRALELDPEFAEAHCNLAGRLRQAGRFAESLAEYERGHELGVGRPDWSYPSSRWVEEARRLVQLRDSRELTGRRAGSDGRSETSGDTAPP